MQIEQKFVVDGQEFNSIEDAQAYVDSQQDRRRVDAFVEHLKATGKAARINKKQTDLILDFIQYEEGVRAGFELEEPAGKSVENVPEQVSQSKASPEPVDAPVTASTDLSDPKPATTAQQEETISEPAPAVEEPAGSKHVDGPDEDLEEDPLAGLDL